MADQQSKSRASVTVRAWVAQRLTLLALAWVVVGAVAWWVLDDTSCGYGGQLTYTNEWSRLAWWPALVATGFKPEDGGKARFVFHSLRHFCASTLLAEGHRCPPWPATSATSRRPSPGPTPTGSETTRTSPPTS